MQICQGKWHEHSPFNRALCNEKKSQNNEFMHREAKVFKKKKLVVIWFQLNIERNPGNYNYKMLQKHYES